MTKQSNNAIDVSFFYAFAWIVGILLHGMIFSKYFFDGLEYHTLVMFLYGGVFLLEKKYTQNKIDRNRATITAFVWFGIGMVGVIFLILPSA